MFASMTPYDHSRISSMLRDGSSPLRLLYITPERLSKSAALKNSLKALMHEGRLTRFVVDEAHW